jgi:hypothetical protein
MPDFGVMAMVFLLYCHLCKSFNPDELAKSLETVMPDLIRHPELFEFAGFRPTPE